MNRLVAIVGPTCAGKTGLSLSLARIFDGEIVNADSRQIYRHMDIATAKPDRKELSLIPHHLISIVNPDEDFSLAQYQQLAYKAIDDIQKRDRLPFLAGGSGLYIWSVLEGWGIPQVEPDIELRLSLEERASTVGKDALHQELMQVDPEAAQKIDPRNVRRTVRALEVYQKAGTPISHLQQKNPPPFYSLIIGLTADRAGLYRRIDMRAEQMVEHGLVEEVKWLAARGYGFDLPSMSGIGYRQIGAYLKGRTTLPAAIEQIKYETHRLVRHQYNWFRLKDIRITWFDIQRQSDEEITALVDEFLSCENN